MVIYKRNQLEIQRPSNDKDISNQQREDWPFKHSARIYCSLKNFDLYLLSVTKIHFMGNKPFK